MLKSPKSKHLLPALLMCLLSVPSIKAQTSSKPLLPIQKTTASLQAASHNQVDSNALTLALTAYNCAVLSGITPQDKLTLVDYSKPSNQKRLWVFDLTHQQVLFNTLVAHGKGSGDTYARHFSDDFNTHASSLGLFLTGQTYFGHDGYSLKLLGLEKDFNDHAEPRAVVMHGAAYVNDTLAQSGRIGRSWGCPAVPKPLAAPVINTIKNGNMVFAYYPDALWLKHSKYLHCS